MIAPDQHAEEAAQLGRMAALAEADGRTDLAARFSASAPTMSAYTLGRCPAKGCKHSTRSEAGRMAADCPAHGPYRLDHVWAYTVPGIKCGARCRGAIGPSCDCACGGANHGAAHGR